MFTDEKIFTVTTPHNDRLYAYASAKKKGGVTRRLQCNTSNIKSLIASVGKSKVVDSTQVQYSTQFADHRVEVIEEY